MHNTATLAKQHDTIELWLDGSSIVRTGVALDYNKLVHILQEKLNVANIVGHFYDSEIPTALLKSEKKTINDVELLRWQVDEQERAVNAGFVLHLSTPWTEKIRCLFCSCMNAVNFPSPLLLDLQADLLTRNAAQAPPLYLLSNTTALLRNLSHLQNKKILNVGRPKTSLTPSEQINVTLIALDDFNQTDYANFFPNDTPLMIEVQQIEDEAS